MVSGRRAFGLLWYVQFAAMVASLLMHPSDEVEIDTCDQFRSGWNNSEEQHKGSHEVVISSDATLSEYQE